MSNVFDKFTWYSIKQKYTKDQMIQLYNTALAAGDSSALDALINQVYESGVANGRGQTDMSWENVR